MPAVAKVGLVRYSWLKNGAVRKETHSFYEDASMPKSHVNTLSVCLDFLFVAV
jgi:hypothetical protein